MSFLELQQASGYILELRRGWPFETQVCSAKSGRLSSYDGHLMNLNSAWQDNTDASGGEAGGQASLFSWHSYTGIPTNFHEESGIVTLEALNSARISRCQTDVKHPVQKRWRPRAFSRVSTGDSDIPSSSEMKDEPACKPLQGNPAFF